MRKVFRLDYLNCLTYRQNVRVAKAVYPMLYKQHRVTWQIQLPLITD